MIGGGTLSLSINHGESLRGSLLVSLGFHGLLAILAVSYTAIDLHRGAGWGNPWGGKGSSARIGVVNSLPGMPLPAPMLATPNTLATENPGLYKEQPQPRPEAPKEAEEIPKFQDATPPKPAIRVNKRIQPDNVPPPNAIPTGEGGRPSLSYGQFVNEEGGSGIGFGEGMFGERYGWYVQATRNRISSNWLMSTISPNIVMARRLYVRFDILRDGTISNIQLAQPSGMPEVDRSALRAVAASNPLGPLPQDFSGSKVSVSFYFDFRR